MTDETYRITTIDNPFSPFDEFDKWYSYDISHGYNTDAAIARELVTSDALPEDIQNQDWNDALDAVIKKDFLKIRRKVRQEDYTDNAWHPVDLAKHFGTA